MTLLRGTLLVTLVAELLALPHPAAPQSPPKVARIGVLLLRADQIIE